MSDRKNDNNKDVIIYYWPTTDSKIGHVSLQVGDVYLSHVPKAVLAKDLPVPIQVRRNIPTREGKPVAVRKQEPEKHRTFKQDKESYKNQDPKIVVIPSNKINVTTVLQVMSDKLSGGNSRNALAPHKPLPHFDVSKTVLRPIAPRNYLSPTGRAMKPYYQLCDSLLDEKDIHTSNYDRSNCATMTADCLGAGISLAEQDKILNITEQFEPGALIDQIVKCFDAAVISPTDQATPTGSTSGPNIISGTSPISSPATPSIAHPSSKTESYS
ncbi:hypothetical protein [Methylobacterium mesophilicum]